jgi:hypothetical protein
LPSPSPKTFTCVSLPLTEGWADMPKKLHSSTFSDIPILQQMLNLRTRPVMMGYSHTLCTTRKNVTGSRVEKRQARKHNTTHFTGIEKR